MRIQHKLISSLVGATLLIGVVGYISVERSQQALEEGVRRSAIRLALSSMNKIEDEIKRRIESFEEYTTELILQKAVKKSNREFDRLEDREAYIDRQDELWIKLAPYSTTSLMSELLVNELSHELIEKVDFLKERHGYPVIRDVVVTNRYGATVALTDRIADYRQDDDRWWKSVRDSGLYVSVHEHDLQDGIYSADVGIRVNDSVGEFIGAMEVVMSAGQIVSGVRELSAKTDYESARYTLVDTAGVVIYDESGEYDHLSDISETEFFRYLVGDYGYQGGAPGIISRGDDNVCAYALMTGIGGAGDIGWILAIQFDAAEVFGPALELRRVIIGITAVLILLAAISGYFISRSITKPLGSLADAAREIGSGQLSVTRFNSSRRDEVGLLSKAFIKMSEDLQSTTTSVDKLNLEIAERKRVEMELSHSQNLYRGLYERAPVAYVSTGVDGVIRSANAAAATLFGAKPEELVGTEVSGYYAEGPSGKDGIEEIFTRLEEGKNSDGVELQMVRLDGTAFWISLWVRPVANESGEITGSLFVMHDISKRKAAEQALRLTQFSVDHTADAAFWVAPDGKFRYVNNTACRMLEYSREELLSMSVLEVSPDFPESAWGEHWLEIKQRKSFSFEAIHQTKSGRQFPVEIRVNYLEFEGKEYNFAFARDISARKSAENALRSVVAGTSSSSSEEFFGKLVLEITSALDVRYAFVGELEREAPERISCLAVCADGEPVENFVYELAGTPCENVVNHKMCYFPRDVATLFPEDRLLADMGVQSYLGVPLFDSEENPLGLLAILHETALQNPELAKDLLRVFAQRAGSELERKRSEVALEQGRELLRATIESTGEGILVVNDKLEVTHTNSRFAEMFHIPQDVVDSRDDKRLLESFLHQCIDAETFLENVRKLHESPDEESDTLQFKDGRVFEQRSCPLEMEGAIAGRVWSFRDITERERDEQERLELRGSLERAKRMESLGILAGGVAHDLNNTLGPLVGYPELILERLPEDAPVREQILRMGKSASEAADVIQDLLALARRGRYEMKPVNLNDVIREYVESPAYTRICQRNPDVSVLIELDKNLGCINGSAPHLSKVVMNLVVNAFDAMSGGGSLEMRSLQRRMDSLIGGYDGIEPGDYALLRVKDTGKGMEAEWLKNIFEPYFSKKAMGISGSGLGLSVVYGVVKDHGGYYDVFSSPGEGAEFVFYFPITPVSEETHVDEASVITGTQSILVVDDVLEQRELADELLTSLGYVVETVAGGREAVEHLRNRSVDILVLDMIMEDGFDGLDTYREIIKTHPGQKAIVVSGFSASGRVQELQKLGAGGYVKKPYTLEELGTAIRKELDRSPVTSKV